MSGPVRIAVLTSRRTGSHVLGALAALREQVTVGWLLGSDVTAVQQLADQHGFVTSQVGKARDWDNVCKDNSVDALVVCSPDASVNMVRRALRSGKSVLCEHPVFLQPSALVACYEEADANDAHLLFGFPRRFDSILTQVKAQLDAGLLGEVQCVTTGITHTQKAASGSSLPDPDALFKEAVSVEVDTVCWLLGTSPRSVYAALASSAAAGSLSHDQPINSTKVVLKFDDAIATIDINKQSQNHHDDRLEIHGSKGVLLLTRSPPDGSSVVSLRLGDAPWRMLTKPGVEARRMSTLSGVLSHLISAVRAPGGHIVDDRHQVFLSFCASHACLMSCRTRRVVFLEPDHVTESHIRRSLWPE